jgi:hypothetical protein
MKNFGLLILGIIVGVAAMYFYSKSDQMEMKAGDIEMKIPGLITPEEATALDQAFNLKHRIISDSLFKESKDGGDNRSSWWKLETIENYLVHAKTQAKDNKKVMDGLRVYLGSYPSEGGQTGLTTMFFIPTGYSSISEGSIIPFQDKSSDLIDSDGLNLGQNGYPPDAHYPQ